MKLYLSSYRIPVPQELAKLLGRPLQNVTVALIPNAQDYYNERARNIKVRDVLGYMERLGLNATVVDLRNFSSPKALKAKLKNCDLIWAMGGNTYMLRYEMRRSGFDVVIRELLAAGAVYGGDSAGALAAGVSIAGVELADPPEFAEELITEGLQLVSWAILPHIDNPEFASVIPIFKDMHKGQDIVELKDSQAVIFDGNKRWVVDAKAEDADLTHEEEPQGQLANRLANAAQQVAVGGRYKHYKQLSYRVLSIALREEDNEPCVVYQAEYGGGLRWVRPVASWLEEVEIDGKKTKRFTKAANNVHLADGV